ncbi:Glutathione S-transferase kappa 1 [Stagonosporopsis vannaccii]|nr:Glutathione S-transferase kappa 1 [Stagonosporopsis vannaccii]
MAQPKITLYIDIVSPFAYIAFYVLKNSPAFKQCTITYVPILLGGLMKTCGNTAPIAIKNKNKWINTERDRWAKYFHVPISPTPPPNFPISTLSIQRALASLSISHPRSLESAIDLLYHNTWVQWSEPTQPENLRALLRTLVGSEAAEQVLERTQTAEVKGELAGNTEKAYDDGAFGLPYFVATNSKGETEGFWGVDHFGQLADFLGVERPAGKGWRALL